MNRARANGFATMYYFIVILPILIFVILVPFDIGRIRLHKHELQTAVDAAVLSAFANGGGYIVEKRDARGIVYERKAYFNPSTARAVALDMFTANISIMRLFKFLSSPIQVDAYVPQNEPDTIVVFATTNTKWLFPAGLFPVQTSELSAIAKGRIVAK